MKSPVTANIKRCFRELQTPEKRFEADFESYCVTHGLGRGHFLAPATLTPLPLMYGSHSSIKCAQSRYFGWYALRAAVRGVMLSVNYLVAAEQLLESELFAPSAATSYTASYHALHAFLALHGRVICDPYQWVGPSNARAAPVVVAGVLTKNNRWQFESRVRTHRGRWLEVRDALAPQEVPPAFEYLFKNLFRNRRRKGTTLTEIIRDPEGTLATIDECWSDLLVAISSIRHEAIYASFGEDPHVVEALWNGDADSQAGIDGQATTLLNFAALLLDDSAAKVMDLVHDIAVPPDLHGWLSATLRMPWFDIPQTNQLPFHTIASNIELLEKWLKPTEDPKKSSA